MKREEEILRKYLRRGVLKERWKPDLNFEIKYNGAYSLR